MGKKRSLNPTFQYSSVPIARTNRLRFHLHKTSDPFNGGFATESPSEGCSKMPGCKASESLRTEAYFYRTPQGRGMRERRRRAFFNSLLMLEVSHAGEDHGYPVLVGRPDGFVIPE